MFNQQPRPGVPDPNQIINTLAMKPDHELQAYAAMHKDDPYTLSLAVAESNRRKAMRAGEQAKMAGLQPPTVADQDIAAMTAPIPQLPPQMPQMPPQQAQQQLPENVGIGQLPAQNMQQMADGGIVGFADGGDVQSFRSGGTPEEDAFNQAFLRTLRYEGGRTNDTGGDTKYGISKKANPDVDIDKLTVEGARRLYKERYWDAISGDKLAARDPKLAQIAFDTAVNQSPAKAKEFITASGGDPAKMMQLRGEHYDSLVQKNPEKYGSFAKGWAARLGNLATDLAIPSAIAGETTTSAPVAPSTKPVAPAVAATPGTDNRAWYDRYRDLMTSGEAQKAMLHGVQDVPSSLVGAPVDLSYYVANKLGRTPVAGEKPVMGSKWIQEKLGNMGLRAADSANPDVQNIREATTGIAGLYNPVGKAEAVETAAQAIARRQAAEAAAAEAKVANPRLAGPTTDTTMVQAPGYAPVINGPAVAAQVADKERAAAEAAKAAQLSQAAKEAGGARQFTNAVNPLGVVAATPIADQGINALTSADKGLPMSDLGFDTSGLDALSKTDKKEIKDVAKETLPNKGKNYSNDFLLSLGLNLMAGQSPNFLTNLGQAGLGALKYTQETKKEEAEQAYREALAKHYGVPGEVQMLEYLKTPANMKAYMQQREAMREPMTREALFKQFMTSNQGMIAKPEEIGPMFQNYVKSYESVMGPIGGLPAGTKVTRIP